MLSTDLHSTQLAPSPRSQATPTLPAIAIAMGQATVAAYAAFEAPSKGSLIPAGYQQVGTVTGWVAQDGGAAELFGLWLQSTSSSTEYMLALRGTVTSADQAADLDYATTSFAAYASGNTPNPVPQVHAGFWGIYSGTGTGVSTSMQAQLFAFLAANTVTSLSITGHSMGGAIAELFALDLAASAPSGAPSSVTTITFAAPKVGLTGSWDTAYASFPATASTIRVVNQDDIVPSQPPSWLAPNYVQVGQEFDVLFYYQQGTPDEQELIIRHEMDNYLVVVSNAQPLTPQRWTGTFADGVYAGITDTSATPSSAAAARARDDLARLPRVPHAVRRSSGTLAGSASFSSSNCGSQIGAASGGPMYPGTALASINGSTNLSQCIKGAGGSYVNSISIEPYGGVVYSNKIVVNGRGPSGFGQRVKLTFTMQGGEQVTLDLASTSVGDHTVKARTEGLVQIAWDFT